MSDYFKVRPEFPDELGDAGGYFMQLFIPKFENTEGSPSARINFAPGEPLSAEGMALMLDIDTFLEPVSSYSPSEIPQILERLRAVKNSLFEGCITEKARELIR